MREGKQIRLYQKIKIKTHKLSYSSIGTENVSSVVHKKSENKSWTTV